MTESAYQSLPFGLYRVYWKDGGTSLASMGNNSKGRRWLAPVNWVGFDIDMDTDGDGRPKWSHISKMELLVGLDHFCDKCGEVLIEFTYPAEFGGVYSAWYHRGGNLFCEPENEANDNEASPIPHPSGKMYT